MSDYSEIEKIVLALVGDPTKAFYTSDEVGAGIVTALGRYAKVVESVEAKVMSLAENGLYGHSLATWGSGLQEVVYVHWPAGASVAATTAANQVTDWWYYRSSADGSLYLDMQVDGSVLPVAGDKIMVVCSTRPWIAGLSMYGTTGAITTVPLVHFHIIAMGAAAYCMRAKEAVFAAQLVGAAYPSVYHVNVLSGLANDMLKEYDAELAKIQEKRLERPPWGAAERKRMRRLESGSKAL